MVQLVEAGNQNYAEAPWPHLIVVFNYGDAMMPLDMLQTKGT
jgi:hypothetical protein